MKRTNRKPSFFWQGVLILAPVLVLAKVGALAIWQDKRMAQHEAELRAQDLAEQAAEVIRQELESTSYALSLKVDREGGLISPPPYSRTLVPPPPPLDTKDLSVEQRNWWFTGQSTREPEQDVPLVEAIQKRIFAYKSFLASSPPTNFAAAAHFALGVLLLDRNAGESRKAAAEFKIVVEHHPTAVTDSGLPLLPLAQFKWLEAHVQSTPAAIGIPSSVSNTLEVILATPSLVTPELLQRVWPGTNVAGHGLDGSNLLPSSTPPPSTRQRREWDAAWAQCSVLRSNALHRWEVEEKLRGLHSEARRRHPTITSNAPSGFWISWYRDASNLPRVWIDSSPSGRRAPNDGVSAPPQLIERGTNAGWVDGNIAHRVAGPGDRLFPDERWFLLRMPNDSGALLLCRNEATVRETIQSALKHLRMPEYLDASVRLADVDVMSSNRLLVLEHVVSGKGGGQFWQRKNAGQPPEVLASATRAEGGRVLLAVSMHLVSPDLLYAQQEQRSIWFGLLIGASMLASVIGFLSAWSAFRKQLRLAEMKSNFISSVSHELRAPIASVRLMAEGLERGKISEPAKQHEYFRFITQECRRLSSMIENVLDFARIEQGRKQYEFEPTDAAALVEKTVQLMEPYAAERGVRLVSKVEGRGSSTGKDYARPHPLPLPQGEGTANDSLRSVRASLANPAMGPWAGETELTATNATDAGCDSPSPRGEGRGEGNGIVANIDGQAVQQALVNLIDNAVKHSPSGSEVVVSLETQNPQFSILNPQFRLSVRDHGSGIPAGEHEKIFERFYRLGSELRRETPGVGIGLSIVKHVAEAHGGRVRVESEAGKGSHFTIELPLNATEARRRRGKSDE